MHCLIIEKVKVTISLVLSNSKVKKAPRSYEHLTLFIIRYFCLDWTYGKCLGNRDDVIITYEMAKLRQISDEGTLFLQFFQKGPTKQREDSKKPEVPKLPFSHFGKLKLNQKRSTAMVNCFEISKEEVKVAVSVAFLIEKAIK